MKDGWHQGAYWIGGILRAQVWLEAGLRYFRVYDSDGREVAYDYHQTVKAARACCERKLAERGEVIACLQSGDGMM